MCYQIVCERCAKPTWNGCGNHIDEALAGVAMSDRCACDARVGTSGDAPSEGTFSRFLGR